MPCAEERGHFNGFLVYGGQHTRALEIHRLHGTQQGLLPRRLAEREHARKKNERELKKKQHPDNTQTTTEC